MPRQLPSLLVFVALTILAALVGSRFMPGAWYAGLAKPTFTPPNWVFPVVWPVLYVLIALAGWLAWRARASLAVTVWGGQLALNALWSYLMFGLHRTDLALAEIILLWLAIAVFVISAWKPARTAALLFLPYLAWVSFALLLNFSVWQLNR